MAPSQWLPQPDPLASTVVANLRTWRSDAQRYRFRPCRRGSCRAEVIFAPEQETCGEAHPGGDVVTAPGLVDEDFRCNADAAANCRLRTFSRQLIPFGDVSAFIHRLSTYASRLGDRNLTAAPSTRSLELPGSAATPADLTQSDLRRWGDLPEAGPAHSAMPSRRSLSWVNETAKSSCLRRGVVI